MAEVRWLLGLLSAALCLPASCPARILGLFPFKGASHFYVFRPLLEELALRGHQVDVVSQIPPSRPLANYTHISVKDPDVNTVGYVDFNRFEETESSFFNNLMQLRYLTSGYDRAHSLPSVLALANVSYDLVIMEMFNSDVFFGLAYKIGAPVIGFSSCQMLPWGADSVGAPSDFPYIPNSAGAHSSSMGFFERIQNIFEIWAARAWYHFVISPEAQETAERYLGPLPDLSEVAANISLLFVNTHFSLFGQRPLPQSVVEVGGINVGKPKPLPHDLEKIMNDSNGVIYFSMGSLLKGSSMTLEKQQMFINTFLASGKTVLWKREENLAKTHAKIITRPWFPQRDILAHPKTELYIGHCGLLGLNEGLVSGVPIICIPMFGDQLYNSRNIIASGMGLALRFATITENQIQAAVNEVLGNEKYKKRAAEISAAFRDRPLSPLDTAVFWTEYLLHHGPRPFNAPFRQMPLWQKLGLDIALFAIGIVFLTVTIVMIILALCGRNKNEVKKVKQS